MAVPELFSYRAVLTSLNPSARCSISTTEQVALFTRSEGRTIEAWTIEDEQCQRVGGGYKGSEVRVFTVSPNGADILSTPIPVQAGESLGCTEGGAVLLNPLILYCHSEPVSSARNLLLYRSRCRFLHAIPQCFEWQDENLNAHCVRGLPWHPPPL